MIAAVFAIRESLDYLGGVMEENIGEVLVKVVINKFECRFFRGVVSWHDQLENQEMFTRIGLDYQLTGLLLHLEFVIDNTRLGLFFGFFKPKQLPNLWQLIPSWDEIVALQNAFEEIECRDELGLVVERQFFGHGLTFLLQRFHQLHRHGL